MIGRLLCRLGLHDERRSQGLVGYCSRGCGDLKRTHASRYGGWVRYVQPPVGDSPTGPPPVATSLLRILARDPPGDDFTSDSAASTDRSPDG